MIFITLTSKGANNTSLTRVIKSDSLDYTSVPAAESVNSRMVNLYEVPEGVNTKVWKKLNKQGRLALLWGSFSRNKRINIVVSMLSEYLGAKSFQWYEIN